MTIAPKPVAVLPANTRPAHHMFATGAILLPFFAFMTFLKAAKRRRQRSAPPRHNPTNRTTTPTHA